MVHVRLMGTFREAAGQSEIQLGDCENIGQAIISLVKLLGNNFEKGIYDPVLNSPLTNALILLNGVEVNNLQGLETQVKEGDNMVLLSVTHGG